MYLRKSGKGEATAGDITPPSGVTIANPEQHIATLAEDGELEIEFTVERGRGYVPAQMNKQDTDEIGRIPVDSIYSPVLKVSYKVEATRVEQRTDFDKLILDVETKPAISRVMRWLPPVRPGGALRPVPRAQCPGRRRRGRSGPGGRGDQPRDGRPD